MPACMRGRGHGAGMQWMPEMGSGCEVRLCSDCGPSLDQAELTVPVIKRSLALRTGERAAASFAK
jgi:hypothetical protein